MMEEFLKSHFYAYTLRIAVFAGICEGFAWMLTSFIGIIWHLTAYGARLIAYDDPFNDLLDTYFYYFFVQIDGHRYSSLIIQPREFFIFMFIYFFLDLVWFISSVLILLGFFKKLDKKKIFFSLIIWTVSSAAVVLIDFTFCILLGLDYKYCIDTYNELKGVTDQRLSVLYWAMCYGIMMVVAIKGFFLWIINLVITGIMIKICIDLKQSLLAEPYNDDIFSSTINSRGAVPIRNLPEEARNREIIDDVPRRRRTEPPTRLQSDILSTSSSFRPLNVNYTYDPYIEERLRRYTITPAPALYQ